MPTPPLPAETVARVRAAWLRPGATARSVSRECGIGQGTAYKYRAAADPGASLPDPAPEAGGAYARFAVTGWPAE